MAEEPLFSIEIGVLEDVTVLDFDPFVIYGRISVVYNLLFILLFIIYLLINYENLLLCHWKANLFFGKMKWRSCLFLRMSLYLFIFIDYL